MSSERGGSRAKRASSRTQHENKECTATQDSNSAYKKPIGDKCSSGRRRRRRSRRDKPCAAHRRRRRPTSGPPGRGVAAVSIKPKAGANGEGPPRCEGPAAPRAQPEATASRERGRRTGRHQRGGERAKRSEGGQKHNTNAATENGEKQHDSGKATEGRGERNYLLNA